MAAPLVDEILNAARSTIRVGEVSDSILNSARRRIEIEKMKERVNAREPGARRDTVRPSSAPSATPLEGPATRPAVEPPVVSNGPIQQQPQLQQQQRTNVGGVGVSNRFLTLGDNADEYGRMRAAQDELDQLLGQGGPGVDDMASSRIREQLGVEVPPANPVPRLEVSDANFKFSDSFMTKLDEALENRIVTSKNYPNNIRPFAETFADNAKLGDMIDDSWEVFRYYPSLKDINLKPLGIFDGLFGTMGAYDNITKTMFLPRNIGRASDRLEEVRSTIIHEVQHYIQDVEGWARGGNVKEFKDLFAKGGKDFGKRRAKIQGKYEKLSEQVNKIPEVERFNRIVDQAHALPKNKHEFFTHDHPRLAALRGLAYGANLAKSRFLSYTYDEVAQALKKQVEYEGSISNIRPEGWAQSVRDEAAQILALKKRLEQYTTIQEQIRLAGKLKKLDAIDKLSFRGYQSLFGEVEARQAQERMNMTDAERAATRQPISELKPIDTIVRGQNQDLKGNIVPGLSFEQGHIVFHGGPVSAIDKFMLKFLGSGEGAIARGWGLYFAQRPGVSVGYRDARADAKAEDLTDFFDMRIPLTFINTHIEDRVKQLIPNENIQADIFDRFITEFQSITEDFVGRLRKTIGSTASEEMYNAMFTNRILPRTRTALLEIYDHIRYVKSQTAMEKYLAAQPAELRNKINANELQKYLDQEGATQMRDSMDYVNTLFLDDQFINDIKKFGIDQAREFILSNKAPSLAEDAGLFVLDLKANKEKDYLHLDKMLADQPKIFNIYKTIKAPDRDYGHESDITGEEFVNWLEGQVFDEMTHPDPGAQAVILRSFTEKGQQAIKRAFRQVLDTGKINDRWSNRKFASLFLKELGIPGSAHYDAKSRAFNMKDKDRTNNFVIWDEDIIEQLAVQPYSWRDRGHLEVDPADHPPTDEYMPK